MRILKQNESKLKKHYTLVVYTLEELSYFRTEKTKSYSHKNPFSKKKSGSI
ncbi:hypothetical protein LEP1GSC062_4149 [Leptospira alexanderi serovar Manhao 3 str. L 60]|uniref:Uncharacterized protein n=1 Tax=Leptospira alexanderi serovar Manhao 3 str. L 60 TaxID=1049759 RepID=V6HVT8_9LEPT|nr:hypothetical protein LEP1GSC062_4149 [Leptospira alexanderi serovar Manhao 3 str. L 60]